MAVRTISRALGTKDNGPRKRTKPAVGKPAAMPHGEQAFEDLANLKGTDWVKFSMRCCGCDAIHVHCINSACEVTSPGLCTMDSSRPLRKGEHGPVHGAPGCGCEWDFAGLVVARQGFPWIGDMPGCFGPGDVFECDKGDRVFVGRKRGGGAWKTIPRSGRWEVLKTGKAKRLV